MDAPMFHPIAEPSRLARCESCGALVDPSEDGRRLHVAWHASMEAGHVLDLTELEERQIAV